MKVLIVTTERQSWVEEWTNSAHLLQRFQTVVGGYIEAINGPGWTAYLNEEGKLDRLPENHTANDLARVLGWRGAPWDVLVGNVVFCGPPDVEGEDTDVPQFVLEAAGVDHD